MTAIIETINKAIELARKNGKKTAIAAFVKDHDDKLARQILEDLAVNGWHASYTRNYSYDNQVSIEYEIEL